MNSVAHPGDCRYLIDQSAILIRFRCNPIVQRSDGIKIPQVPGVTDSQLEEFPSTGRLPVSGEICSAGCLRKLTEIAEHFVVTDWSLAKLET
jgi:hypothetical protein